MDTVSIIIAKKVTQGYAMKSMKPVDVRDMFVNIFIQLT